MVLYKPYEGKIIVGVVNIDEVSQESVGRKLSIVMQNPQLFNLTIKENLTLVKRNSNLNELIDASQKAYIYDFIESLPDRFEINIGEWGVKLFSRQKQGLAIARTILFNPDIIIFDEATSSLDSESEKAVLQAISDLSKSKTIITIVHRLSSVIESNKVLVMDASKIVVVGCHEELKDNNDVYDLLIARQYEVQ